MGKRVVAVVVGALVAVTLVVGGVLLAGNRQRTPATLPALDVSSSGARSSQSAAPSGGTGSPDSGTESRISPSGRVQYQVRGKLPDLPRSAKAWTLPDQVSRDRVAQLARTLGMAGEPTRSGQTWTVTDGTRRLFVNQLPGGPWTMTDSTAACGGPVGGIPGKGGSGPRIIGCPAAVPIRPGSAPGAAATPAQPDQASATATLKQASPPAQSTTPAQIQPPKRVPLPDRGTAERIARELFGRTAAPMDGTDVQLVEGFDRWSVSAFPKVGGMPTSGFLWTAAIGAKGRILSATGWLDSPRAGDVYPLITVQEALQRLRERQVSGPIIAPDLATPCARTAQPSPGGCGPAKPLNFQVTDARLGLQYAVALTKPGGGQTQSFLVPAYQFQLDGSWNRQVSVIAVQDKFLATTPTPTAVPLRPGG